MTAQHAIPADRLIAHRGYQRSYPENSLLALEQAILCGALLLETDVQFSADGIPLLYHDVDLKRISGQHGTLAQYSFDTLQALTAGEPCRFGTQFEDVRITPLSALTSLLLRHPDVQVLVELKEEAVQHYGAVFCLEKIRDALSLVMARCILISFDLDALRAAKKIGFQRLAPVLRDWSIRHDIATALSAEMIVINHQRIPKNDAIQMHNCKVAVYEIDDAALAQNLLQRGASYIETFDIGGMLRHRLGES